MAEVELELDVPCVHFPELPNLLEIELIGGVRLSAFLDFSKGMPNPASVVFSLLQQLAPVLAGLAPILNILAVIKALADFATNPLVKGPDLIIAINKIASMFVALTPAGIAVTIVGILRVIITFLQSFIVQLKAVLEFQAKIALIEQEISLDPAKANLVLSATISCAKANADIAMQQTMASLGPLQPLLAMVQIIAGIAGLSLALPDLSASASASGGLEMIASLEEAITNIQGVIDSLPV